VGGCCRPVGRLTGLATTEGRISDGVDQSNFAIWNRQVEITVFYRENDSRLKLKVQISQACTPSLGKPRQYGRNCQTRVSRAENVTQPAKKGMYVVAWCTNYTSVDMH
jgi:hypothetical protein